MLPVLVGGWSVVVAVDALAVLDPAALADEELLDYIHTANRAAAFAQACETAAVAAFAARRPPLEEETPDPRHPDLSRWAAGELMALYAISAGTAQHRLDEAETLTATLPATFARYREGLLDATRIKAIHRGIENVPPAIASLIEPLFLPGAARMNPAALTRKIRRLAQTHNPEPLAERHERARTRRSVWFTPLPDGMAMLTAVLPAAPALSLFESLQAWAREAKKNGETSTALTPTGRPSRSQPNLLADCYLDLLHQAFLHPADTRCCECPTCATTANNRNNRNNGNNGTGNNRNNLNNGSNGKESGAECTSTCNGGAEPRFKPRIPAKINVTVPVMTLLGRSQEPGTLDGYGPIPPEQAIELAAGASSWIRILTHPETGTRLSVGRESYTPPIDLAREVRLRNPVCTGIGCDRPAGSCELDHTIPFHQNRYTPHGTPLPQGETSITNLLPRSKYCHRLKDNPTTGWTVEPLNETTTQTTTPTGRIYLHTHNTNDTCPF